LFDIPRRIHILEDSIIFLQALEEGVEKGGTEFCDFIGDRGDEM